MQPTHEPARSIGAATGNQYSRDLTSTVSTRVAFKAFWILSCLEPLLLKPPFFHSDSRCAQPHSFVFRGVGSHCISINKVNMINSKLLILIIALILGTLVSAAPYESASSVNLDITSVLQRTWKGMACLGACRSSWGWTGNHFGADPWGGVLKAGDPLPYSDGANAQSGSPTSSSSEISSSYSTIDPGLNIQDVTSSTELAPTSTVSFPVFNVPALIKCV